MRKITCLVLSGLLAAAAMPVENPQLFNSAAVDYTSKEVDALQYSYEIYPLLEPFNNYFYVRTDNPNPESFRFFDKSSPYSETSVIENNDSLYADVEYENAETYRVNGGYIFKSGTTDGGEIVLQIHEDITRAEFNLEVYGTENPEFSGYSPYHGMPVDTYDESSPSGGYFVRGYLRWKDSDIKFTLPELCDNCDYLIKNYATEADFFSNMSAVQEGFSSICLYSGSYVRGEVYRTGERDWRLANSPHVDQPFYIYSPFARKDSKSLFASAIYPFRYDSLGFPSMMKSVAMRLDESAVCDWNTSVHAFMDVTYNGETKTFGGQGNGEGQGVSEDKIIRRFSFEENIPTLTLQDTKTILEEYMAVEMDDDVPRDNALDWEKIYNAVGSGKWVNTGENYTYLYQKDDKCEFVSDEWGVGHSLYWGGSLGFCSDMWVDGRYINKYKKFVKDATSEEYPESAVMVSELTVPDIIECKKEMDSATGVYVYTSAEISEIKQNNVVFRYDSAAKLWKADTYKWGSKNSFSVFEELIGQGVIDEKYLDVLTLTQEEVAALVNNGNTNKNPDNGVLFDGYALQGTEYLIGDCNNDGVRAVSDAVTLQSWLLGSSEATEPNMINSDLCKDNKLNVYDFCLLKEMILSE